MRVSLGGEAGQEYRAHPASIATVICGDAHLGDAPTPSRPARLTAELTAVTRHNTVTAVPVRHTNTANSHTQLPWHIRPRLQSTHASHDGVMTT